MTDFKDEPAPPQHGPQVPRPHLPPSHESDIRSAIELPGVMPAEWVEQIKKAMPSFWPTLLGSSVLAALIGWASSYFTAQMTINANSELEKTKIKLQLAEEQARTRSSAYAELASDLDGLHQALSSYLILVQVVYEGPAKSASKSDVATLSDRLSEVGKAEARVIKVESNLNLNPNTLKSDIDQCLGDLVQMMQVASTDPQTALSHQSIDGALIKLAFRAQQEVSIKNLQSP